MDAGRPALTSWQHRALAREPVDDRDRARPVLSDEQGGGGRAAAATRGWTAASTRGGLDGVYAALRPSRRPLAGTALFGAARGRERPPSAGLRCDPRGDKIATLPPGDQSPQLLDRHFDEPVPLGRWGAGRHEARTPASHLQARLPSRKAYQTAAHAPPEERVAAETASPAATRCGYGSGRFTISLTAARISPAPTAAAARDGHRYGIAATPLCPAGVAPPSAGCARSRLATMTRAGGRPARRSIRWPGERGAHDPTGAGRSAERCPADADLRRFPSTCRGRFPQRVCEWLRAIPPRADTLLRRLAPPSPSEATLLVAGACRPLASPARALPPRGRTGGDVALPLVCAARRRCWRRRPPTR